MQPRTPYPVTASIRRTPAATDDSEMIFISPISPVFEPVRAAAKLKREISGAGPCGRSFRTFRRTAPLRPRLCGFDIGLDRGHLLGEEDVLVHELFNLRDFFCGESLEVREIETEPMRVNV